MSCWPGYLSKTRCKYFAYVPAHASDTQSSLESSKSTMVYFSGASLLRLSQKRGL